MPFANLKDLKAGDKVRTDGGFTCMPEGATRTVRAGEDGLYVRCDDGRHYLDGQHDARTGECIGLSKVA